MRAYKMKVNLSRAWFINYGLYGNRPYLSDSLLSCLAIDHAHGSCGLRVVSARARDDCVVVGGELLGEELAEGTEPDCTVKRAACTETATVVTSTEQNPWLSRQRRQYVPIRMVSRCASRRKPSASARACSHLFSACLAASTRSSAACSGVRPGAVCCPRSVLIAAHTLARTNTFMPSSAENKRSKQRLAA